MGVAGLAIISVATGRFDVNIERYLAADIAAGGLIVECAGGEFCGLSRRTAHLPDGHQQRPAAKTIAIIWLNPHRITKKTYATRFVMERLPRAYALLTAGRQRQPGAPVLPGLWPGDDDFSLLA